ncbi:MAG: hypothetical protein ABJH68_21795 [Ilumatobacter sp.]|uniref:hypothetical protein n=1 Tax=Ilumatobacter sp. TaxID=1967498 RepID=UPI0032987BD8
MSVLAHVFEAAGIATVVLSSIREMAVAVAPPRALHCEFPLGRPLGKPGDSDYQHDVLTRAFALLDASEGPVLVDHPDVIEADDEAVSCTLPPRFDPSLPPSVDEARGLRKAYDRAVARRGVTSVGRVVDADGVPDALAVLHSIANGEDWSTAGIPGGNTTAICHDIRTYYEEASLELVDGPLPGGRALEDWFFERTEAGATVLAARTAIRDSGAKFPIWFYMTPGQR